jgi:hypothetical protein
VKKFNFVIAPAALVDAMLGDIGNGPASINGDRSSGYFVVAKETDGDGEVKAALIENKAFLKSDERFYSIHLIDDITMADCELICTDDLSRKSLARTVEEMYGSIRNRMK